MENVERCIKALFFCGRMAWQLKFYREALQTLKNNKAKSFINIKQIGVCKNYEYYTA